MQLAASHRKSHPKTATPPPTTHHTATKWAATAPKYSSMLYALMHLLSPSFHAAAQQQAATGRLLWMQHQLRHPQCWHTQFPPAGLAPLTRARLHNHGCTQLMQYASCMVTTTVHGIADLKHTSTGRCVHITMHLALTIKTCSKPSCMSKSQGEHMHLYNNH